MKIINYLPQRICIYKTPIIFEPSETPLYMCNYESDIVNYNFKGNLLPVCNDPKNKYLNIVGFEIPKKTDGIITTKEVAKYLKHYAVSNRNIKIFIVDNSPNNAIRDVNGNVVAIKHLIHYITI